MRQAPETGLSQVEPAQLLHVLFFSPGAEDGLSGPLLLLLFSTWTGTESRGEAGSWRERQPVGQALRLLGVAP